MGNKMNKGRDKQGQFTANSEAAREAGHKGGEAAQRSNNAHELSSEERAEGGRNSHSGGRPSQNNG